MNQEEISQLLAEAVQKQFAVESQPIVEQPEAEFGDFTTNIAMQLARQLAKAPRDIAQQLVAVLTTDHRIAHAEVAGPGFINITVTDQVLAASLRQITSFAPSIFKDRTVVIEYSDPNPFKVLHAGHLYTTIVGDVIARLVAHSGAQVHRLNYGGDVGLHVGKAMWAIIEFLRGELPEKLADIPKDQRAEWVSARYVEGAAAYEDDPVARPAIIAVNKRVYQLHAGNDHESPFAQIYWTCRQWSYDGFMSLYEQLQITPFERFVPESEVTPQGLELVRQGSQSGVFQNSKGATVFAGEQHGLHTRVFITAEQLPTYEAKDLGLAALKWRDYSFDTNIIITANDIVEYMKVVVQALSNFYPEAAQRTKHLTHGLVKLPGGLKMSSRKGNSLLAQDVLQAAREAAQALHGAAEPEVVLGAIKYTFLRQRIGGDITYDPKDSVSLEGNSGPYLQYAHARGCSILAKLPPVPATFEADFDDNERLFAQKIAQYPAILQLAIQSLAPHHLCSYLYELTQVFNRFYEHNRVVGDPRQAQRAALVQLYTNIVAGGLHLLGIAAPERLEKKEATNA